MAGQEGTDAMACSAFEHPAVTARGHSVIFLEFRAEMLRREESGTSGNLFDAQSRFHEKTGGLFDAVLLEKLERGLMKFPAEPIGQGCLTDLEESGQRFHADLLPEVPDQIFFDLVRKIVRILRSYFQRQPLKEFIYPAGGAHDGFRIRLGIHAVQNGLAESRERLRVPDRNALRSVQLEGAKQFGKQFARENETEEFHFFSRQMQQRRVVMRLEQNAVSAFGNEIVVSVPEQQIAGNNVFGRIERLIVPAAQKEGFRPLPVRIPAEQRAILPDLLHVFPFFLPSHGSVDIDGGKFRPGEKISALLFENGMVLQQSHWFAP